MIYYLDTSALIKRYLTETGSRWIRDVVQPAAGHLWATSQLTTIEINSAFARRRREGTVTPAQYADCQSAFAEDCVTLYQLVEIGDTVLALARDLVQRHPLRTLDALQLASALLVSRLFAGLNLTPLTFLSADDRLLAVAQAEGLQTDNPNLYP